MIPALVSLLLFASADDLPKLSEAGQKELKKFEGKWKVTAMAMDGQERAADDNNVVVEFKDRKLVVKENDQEAKEFFDVAALDPSTTPKILDLKALVDEGPLAKGTTYEAIYKLDDDTLTLAIYAGPDKKRPEKFESAQGSGVVVVTMKREKK